MTAPAARAAFAARETRDRLVSVALAAGDRPFTATPGIEAHVASD